MTAIPLMPLADPLPGAMPSPMPRPSLPMAVDPFGRPLDVPPPPMVASSMAPAPTAFQAAAVAVPSAREDASVRVMLVEELPQVASHIGDLLRGHEHVALVETVTDGHSAMERIWASRPDVVLIDALMQGRVSGLQVARSLRAAGMATPVIFLSVPDRPITLTPEMGLAATVTLPIDRPALLRQIERLDVAHRGPVSSTPSGTFVVFSGKGGVGRTVIAHNLAAALRLRKDARVALIDGDMVHGDLRLHLDAPVDAPSLLQLPTGHVTPEDVSAVLWRDPAGIDVLLAPPRLEQAEFIVQRDMENALAMLQKCYDVVVIDAPARMDDMTLAMLDRADVVVDVVTGESGSLRKTQRCRQVLAAAGFPMEKIVTVVNRADPAGADASRVAAVLGSGPDIVLLEEPAMARAAAAGRPVFSDPTARSMGGAFAMLAGVLVARAQGGGDADGIAA